MNGTRGVDPDDAHARAKVEQPNEKSLTAIWIAMMASIVVYGALVWFLAPRATLTVEQELEQWILVFLAMTAGLHVLVVFLLRQMIAALARSSYVTFCVIRWAFMEGIGVYGLVLALLGVDLTIALVFFAVALMLLASARPGPSDRVVFVRQYE